MDNQTKHKLYNFLFSIITEERKAIFEKVLNYRTRHITVMLENIYQAHNASAVLRSCDLSGIQDVHIVEGTNKYNVNPQISMGSAKWLNLYKYSEKKDNTIKTIQHLRKQGYKIVATTPHKDCFGPNELPLDNKIALLFGTELTGLSDVALENADEFIKIPQFGFTESYNISVSVALILFSLTNRLHNSDIKWHLSKDQLLDIKLDWARQTISRSELVEEQFLKTII